MYLQATFLEAYLLLTLRLVFGIEDINIISL